MKQNLTHKHKLSMLAGLLIALALQTLISSAAIETVVVRPVPDTTTYITNPGIGWQNVSGSSNRPVPETVIYANRASISWLSLNPAPNSYDWRALDNELARAVTEGKQLSFRVYTMRGESWGGHQVPSWVASQSRVILSSGEPNYSSCIYQEHWATVVNQLRLRYDGNPVIAFIDISGYGNFNEWSWHTQTAFDNNALDPASVDGKARRRLADMYIGGSSSNHQCIGANGQVQTVAYSYPGFQTTQLVMPFAGIRQSTQYVASRRSDVGIRFDCLGRLGSANDGVIAMIGPQIEATWRNAPVIFEMCSNISTEDRYMNEADTLLRFSHASLVHDNSPGQPRDPNRLQELVRSIGYRYQLRQATFPGIVSAGSTLNLNMIWQNVGYAPSYPRMGQRFSLYVYLTDGNGSILTQTKLSTRIDQWMPAAALPGTAPDNQVDAALSIPAGLSGTYSVRVAVINERTNQPINLAINGKDARGFYLIGSVNVTSSSVPSATRTVVSAPATSTPTSPVQPTLIIPTSIPATVVPPTPVPPTPVPPTPVQINRPPTITAISNQTSALGTGVTLQVVANDPENRPLRYTDSGTLPLGLTISASSGLIVGNPQSAGQFNVTIRAIDDAGQAGSTSFIWTVTQPSDVVGVPRGSNLGISIKRDKLNELTSEFTYRLTNNGSAAVSNLSVRIYFTVDNGLSVTDYELKTYWDQSGAARISQPAQASGSVYYFTINYGSTSLQSQRTWEWYGSLHLKSWGRGSNSENDWWRQGSYSGNFTSTHTLPIYVSNSLVLGSEPNPQSPPVVVLPPSIPPATSVPALPTPMPANPLPTPIMVNPAPPVIPPSGSANINVSLRGGVDKHNSADFRLELDNRGASGQSNISLRVYFTPDGGRSANSYRIETYWDSVGSASISGPFQGAGNHHYFIISYGNRELRPGTTWKWDGILRTSDWSSGMDSANDWWKTGGFFSNLTATHSIPVYVNNVRVAGQEPQ